MTLDEWAYLGGALLAGFLLGALIILPFAIRARRRRAPEEPPQPGEPTVLLEVVEEDALPDARRDDEDFSIARAFPPGPAPPSSAIPMEWGARYEGGPVPPDRVRGVCSGCGTKLTVSRRKPLRIACPVCGRTRLLT